MIYTILELLLLALIVALIIDNARIGPYYGPPPGRGGWWFN